MERDATNDAPGSGAAQPPDAPAAGDPVSAVAAGAQGTGADEDLKARYREALAHKHGSSGAHRTEHGDKGEAAHSQSAGPTQKMFRRKAGG